MSEEIEMDNRVLSCEERIDKELKRVIGDFKRAMESINEDGQVVISEDEVYEDIIEWLNSYALSYEDDPHYRAKRLELSWGGPSDYFLFFESGDIEYHFLDWFDGASRKLTGEDYEIMKRFYDEVLNI